MPAGRTATAAADATWARHTDNVPPAADRCRAPPTTIDSLFGPLQTTETRGRAWLYENKQLKSVQLRLGVSDGTFSEVIDGELKEGQEVVINMLTGLEPVARPASQGTGNPLMGPQRGGPGGPAAATVAVAAEEGSRQLSAISFQLSAAEADG